MFLLTGILDDSFALSMAGQLPLSSLLTLMGAYREEPDYTMLSNLISVMTNDYSTLVNTCFSLYYFQYEDEEDIHVFLMLVFLLAITG